MTRTYLAQHELESFLLLLLLLLHRQTCLPIPHAGSLEPFVVNKVLQLGKHACLYPMQVALVPCTKQGVQEWTLQIVLVSLILCRLLHIRC